MDVPYYYDDEDNLISDPLESHSSTAEGDLDTSDDMSTSGDTVIEHEDRGEAPRTLGELERNVVKAAGDHECNTKKFIQSLYDLHNYFSSAFGYSLKDKQEIKRRIMANIRSTSENENRCADVFPIMDNFFNFDE
jgi:hypothetical protein